MCLCIHTIFLHFPQGPSPLQFISSGQRMDLRLLNYLVFLYHLCGVSTVIWVVVSFIFQSHASKWKHVSSIINLLNSTYRVQTGLAWYSSEQKEKLLNAKVSDVRFELCVTNHWIACIPRQRHSNRPWYSLVKPAGGGEGGSGWERSQEEMKWTWLGVCFIFSCKYESKWREWRSLCLLNYFYCSGKK